MWRGTPARSALPTLVGDLSGQEENVGGGQRKGRESGRTEEEGKGI